MESWNPVTGCTKISQGCKHCYAEHFAKQLQMIGASRYANGFQVTLHEDKIDLPLTWRKPRRVFVNSMSDLFHVDVPLDFIQRVFATMERCPQHTFMALTKRSDRRRELADQLPWPKNVWMGVSVEDTRVIHRIADLQQVNAANRFLSLEPLIGPLDDLPLEGIHRVVGGRESGPDARPMKREWVESIQRQCEAAGVSFYFREWGSTGKDQHGRELNERAYEAKPQRNPMPIPRTLTLPLF